MLTTDVGQSGVAVTPQAEALQPGLSSAQAATSVARQEEEGATEVSLEDAATMQASASMPLAPSIAERAILEGVPPKEGSTSLGVRWPTEGHRRLLIVRRPWS